MNLSPKEIVKELDKYFINGIKKEKVGFHPKQGFLQLTSSAIIPTTISHFS